jgi:hypothetical protein
MERSVPSEASPSDQPPDLAAHKRATTAIGSTRMSARSVGWFHSLRIRFRLSQRL